MDGGVACRLADHCDSYANVTSGENDTHVLLLPEYTSLVAAIAVMIAVCAAGVLGLTFLAIECLATTLVRNVFHGMSRPRKASETIDEEFAEAEEDDQNEYTDAYDDTRRETTFVGPTASQV